MERVREILDNFRDNWGYLSSWKRATVIYEMIKFLTKWFLVVLLVKYLLTNS